MALGQTKKRASDAMESDVQATTPTVSPVRKKMKITQSQKQVLIDNLQLEVTERARHLRAHYALQGSDLRARIERRINRIPVNLRKANIGELFNKHAIATQSTLPSKSLMYADTNSANNASRPTVAVEGRPLPAIPKVQNTKLPSPVRPVEVQTTSAPRGKKRKSSEIVIATDKENENIGDDNLSVVKNPKRAKKGAVARNISRTNKNASVLSPKSHNSRTLPNSPIKDVKALPCSPSKPSYIARPVSPLKPASPLKSAASAATSAISASIHGMMAHTKRGTATGKLSRTTSEEKSVAQGPKGKMLPPPRPVAASGPSPSSRGRTASASSNQSAMSSTSTTSTTTVVKKAGKAGGSKITVQETATKATSKTALRKTTAASAAGKKVVVAEPAAGRRVLRKRN